MGSDELLLVDHFAGHTAVYDQVYACDEVIVRVSQVKTSLDDIAGLADSAGRVLFVIGFAEILIAAGCYPTGTDAVDANPVCAQGYGKRMSEADYAGFGSGARGFRAGAGNGALSETGGRPFSL